MLCKVHKILIQVMFHFTVSITVHMPLNIVACAATKSEKEKCLMLLLDLMMKLNYMQEMMMMMTKLELDPVVVVSSPEICGTRDMTDEASQNSCNDETDSQSTITLN